ncbi:hypothetical protein JHW43_000545 [Diplocarpon mali]|nr:hypothetical protein JHW43_000545 [Diplocarpon mali]
MRDPSATGAGGLCSWGTRTASCWDADHDAEACRRRRTGGQGVGGVLWCGVWCRRTQHESRAWQSGNEIDEMVEISSGGDPEPRGPGGGGVLSTCAVRTLANDEICASQSWLEVCHSRLVGESPHTGRGRIALVPATYRRSWTSLGERPKRLMGSLAITFSPLDRKPTKSQDDKFCNVARHGPEPAVSPMETPESPAPIPRLRAALAMPRKLRCIGHGMLAGLRRCRASRPGKPNRSLGWHDATRDRRASVWTGLDSCGTTKAGRVVDAAHHKILGDEMHDARERAAAKGPPPLSGRADGRIRASTITQRGAAGEIGLVTPHLCPPSPRRVRASGEESRRDWRRSGMATIQQHPEQMIGSPTTVMSPQRRAACGGGPLASGKGSLATGTPLAHRMRAAVNNRLLGRHPPISGSGHESVKFHDSSRACFSIRVEVDVRVTPKRPWTSFVMSTPQRALAVDRFPRPNRRREPPPVFMPRGAGPWRGEREKHAPSKRAASMIPKDEGQILGRHPGRTKSEPYDHFPSGRSRCVRLSIRDVRQRTVAPYRLGVGTCSIGLWERGDGARSVACGNGRIPPPLKAASQQRDIHGQTSVIGAQELGARCVCKYHIAHITPYTHHSPRQASRGKALHGCPTLGFLVSGVGCRFCLATTPVTRSPWPYGLRKATFRAWWHSSGFVSPSDILEFSGFLELGETLSCALGFDDLDSQSGSCAQNSQILAMQGADRGARGYEVVSSQPSGSPSKFLDVSSSSHWATLSNFVSHHSFSKPGPLERKLKAHGSLENLPNMTLSLPTLLRPSTFEESLRRNARTEKQERTGDSDGLTH